MAAYADSAIDYNFTVEYISVASNYMRVLYQSADSTDGRPDIRQNFRIETFNDSAVIDIATDRENLSKVVEIWNSTLRNESDGVGFDPDSYSSLTLSQTYRPLVDSGRPTLSEVNYNQFKLDISHVQSGNREVRTYTPVLMDSAEKSEYREILVGSTVGILLNLKETGQYDSITSILGDSDTVGSYLDSDVRAQWIQGEVVPYESFLDSSAADHKLVGVLRDLLDFDSTGGFAADSAWSQFLYNSNLL